MTAVEPLLRAELAQLMLEMTRITGLIIVTPVPWEIAPKQVKAAMVLLLAVLAHGQANGTIFEISGAGYVAAHVVSEFVAGVAMGFVVRLAIAAAEIAGTTIAPLIGFGAAQVFDPGTGQSDSVLARLLRLLAILLAIAMGLHRVILANLLQSFAVVPVGSIAQPGAAGPYFIELTARILMSGVRLALPVLAVLLMVQLALGFIARAAPAMQIFNVGFAVLLTTGGVVLILALPDLGQEMLALLSHTGTRMESALMALSGL